MSDRFLETLVATFSGALLAFAFGQFAISRQRYREELRAFSAAGIVFAKQDTDFLNLMRRALERRSFLIQQQANCPLWMQYKPIVGMSATAAIQDSSALSFLTGERGGTDLLNDLLEVQMRHSSLLALFEALNESKKAFMTELARILPKGELEMGIPGHLLELHLLKIPGNLKYELESLIVGFFDQLENDDPVYRRTANRFNSMSTTLEAKKWWLFRTKTKIVRISGPHIN